MGHVRLHRFVDSVGAWQEIAEARGQLAAGVTRGNLTSQAAERTRQFVLNFLNFGRIITC